jgi:hypothetical protein
MATRIGVGSGAAAHSDHPGCVGDRHDPLTISDSEDEIDKIDLVDIDSDVEDVASSQGGVLPAFSEVFFLCVHHALRVVVVLGCITAFRTESPYTPPVGNPY